MRQSQDENAREIMQEVDGGKNPTMPKKILTLEESVLEACECFRGISHTQC